MNSQPVFITPERPEDFQTVEQLSAEAFGPGRFTRTAFRLREGVPPDPELSFVMRRDGELVGSVRQTCIHVGDRTALLLGPLVVAVAHKNTGIGRALMKQAVFAAREAGHEAIILVGDLPYYQKFGFEIVPQGQIILPGPVDPERLLICPLKEKVLDVVKGIARPWH